MKFSTKLAALVIGFGLAAAPAFALDGGDDPATTTDTTATDTTATTLQPTVTQTPQGPPTTIPPAYGPRDNPGSSHVPPAQARAWGRKACQQFKGIVLDLEPPRNESVPRNEFALCILAAMDAIRTGVTPRQACAAQTLSRKRQVGEPRSAFNACVVAGAHALRLSRA
jgi:hypothetical protein